MPQLQDTEVKVQHVAKGDIISTSNDNTWPVGAIVTDVKVGTKWVVLRSFGDHLIRRVEIDTLVTVQRMQDTDEELDARRDAYLLNQATVMLAKMDAAFGEAAVDLKNTLDAGHVPADRQLEALMEGEILTSYGARIHAGIEHHGDSKTLVELFQMLADELERRLIEANPGGRWSGGYTIQNAREQLNADVVRKLYRAIKFNYNYYL